MSKQEIWKFVKNCNNIYEISSFGNVRNKKGLILKPSISTCGYLQVGITYPSKRKTRTIHQLVGEAFLDFTQNGVCDCVIDHIDNNKVNNNLDNLHLVDRRYNTHKVKKINSSSQYKGVSFDKQRSLWRCSIFYSNKHNHLGFFTNEQEANNCYQKNLELINKNNFIVKNRIGTSKYKGVCKTKNNTWRACIKINSKSTHIGMFKTEEEAHQAIINFIITNKK